MSTRPGWTQSDPEWMESIPTDAILLGDVNAVVTWDPRHANDACRYSDRILEETLLEKGFEVLNDGSTTR